VKIHLYTTLENLRTYQSELSCGDFVEAWPEAYRPAGADFHIEVSLGDVYIPPAEESPGLRPSVLVYVQS
jgi:hypothetical protein